MSSEQYQIFRQDFDNDNALQWLCDSCKDQDKEITQNETPYHMRQDERQRRSEKVSIRHINTLTTGVRYICTSISALVKHNSFRLPYQCPILCRLR